MQHDSIEAETTINAPVDLSVFLNDESLNVVVQQVVHVFPRGRFEAGPDTLVVYGPDNTVERVVNLGTGGAERLFLKGEDGFFTNR